VVDSLYFDREIRVIGFLREDGLVRGEASVKVDCEKLDWWLRVVSDDIDLLLKSREDGEAVNVKLLRSGPPEDGLPFSPIIGRLKTLALIHAQPFLYGFNASSPKKAKIKMMLEAGIVHQMIIIFVIDWGGKLEVGNKPIREESLWTLSQLIHGRRPTETFEKRLKAVNDVPKIISIRAIAMRRIYRLVVKVELDC
jgi:hypothetical protein